MTQVRETPSSSPGPDAKEDPDERLLSPTAFKVLAEKNLTKIGKSIDTIKLEIPRKPVTVREARVLVQKACSRSYSYSRTLTTLAPTTPIAL